MSNQDNRPAVDALDHLPEEQVAILAALEPYEALSMPKVVDITGIPLRNLQHDVPELERAGLLRTRADPDETTKQSAIGLTYTGKEHIRAMFPSATALLRRAMGFYSRFEEGRP